MQALGAANVYDPKSGLYFYINICDVVGVDGCPDSHVCVKGTDGVFTPIGSSFEVVPTPSK